MATAKPKTPTVGPLATPEGRLSFPHLTAPETTGQFPSGKFVATLLIPKTADLTAMKAAILTAAQQMWPNLNITSLGQVRTPFRDGDERKQQPGMENHYYIKCKSTFKPAIYGLDRKEYIGPIKAGDFVRLSVVAFPFKNNLDREVAMALKQAGKLIVEGVDEQGRQSYWRPAVTFMLDSVQFRREGPAFGGGGSATVFDDGDAPSAAGANDIFG